MKGVKFFEQYFMYFEGLINLVWTFKTCLITLNISFDWNLLNECKSRLNDIFKDLGFIALLSVDNMKSQHPNFK